MRAAILISATCFRMVPGLQGFAIASIRWPWISRVRSAGVGFPTRLRGVGCLLPAFVVLLSGCGARQAYRVDRLELRRAGWDTLLVDVSFTRSTVVGGSAPVEPDTAFTSVFDDAYRVIYAGAPGSIPIPDRRLGDEAPITVEACGIIGARRTCVQDVLYASPKRMTVGEDIDFPSGRGFAEGSYAFAFRIERRSYGGERWERIDPVGVGGYVTVEVVGRRKQEQGIVRFPVVRWQGRFDLSRHAQYPNFRYDLDEALFDEARAKVRFHIHASLGGESRLLKTVDREVLRKTDDERAEEVHHLVEQASKRLLDDLGLLSRDRPAMAYVDGWTFNRILRIYRIEMRLRWGGSFRSRRNLRVRGELEVGEDGSDALFRLHAGNQSVVQRWREQSGGDTMDLGTLDILR